MKLFWKALLVVLILAIGLPFVLRDEEGRPLMSLQDWGAPKIKVPDLPKLPDAAELVAKAKKSLPDLERTPEAKPIKVYKWVDAKGTVHYSNTPNPNGKSEEIVTNPNANIMPTPKAAKPKEVKRKGTTANTPPVPLPTSIPLAKIPELIEDAQQLKELANQRNEDFETAMKR